MITFVDRLRQCAFDRPRGLEPGKVLVSRADLLELIFHFQRLDGEVLARRDALAELIFHFQRLDREVRQARAATPDENRTV